MEPRALGLGAVARAAILAVLMALFVRTFLIETLEVESASMSPTLLPGDHVLVNRMLYSGGGWPLLPRRPVERGDVVVLKRPGEARLVKRVAFLPGERVETGESVEKPGSLAQLRSTELYVLGDHLARSRDSRHWGPASVEWLRGHAFLIYWSVAKPGQEDRAQREDWDKIGANAWSRIRSTRWDRWLRPIR